MRGYFAIGVERISKALNIGNLFRSAHAFGASFVFTIDAQYKRHEGSRSDTSDTLGQLPFYSFPNLTSMILPESCSIVGVELTEQAVELPSFRHPPCSAYIMGAERESLSNELSKRCDYLIKIPTKFCVNVGIAGAIVMYDRLNSLGHFPRRPTRPGGATFPLSEHQYGGAKIRKKMRQFKTEPPLSEVKLAELETS
jgi:tRNA G18 (ribose-2'-O)-methylase SpoU